MYFYYLKDFTSQNVLAKNSSKLGVGDINLPFYGIFSNTGSRPGHIFGPTRVQGNASHVNTLLSVAELWVWVVAPRYGSGSALTSSE